MIKKDISVLALATSVLSLSLIGSIASSVAVNPIQSVEAATKGRTSNNCVPIGASGDNVYVAWISNKTGNWEAMFRTSNDNGKSFADKINISNSPSSDSLDPDIAASGDDVYVAWHDNKTGNWDTYIRTSKDRGQTFGNIVSIKGTGTMSQKDKLGIPSGLDILQDSNEATHVAASDNNVYVVSWDKKTGNWEVFLAKSTDNGATFGDTINISNSPNTRSDAAHIYALKDNVYMTWWETSKNGTTIPVFRASNDNGESFGPVLKLAANGTIGSSGGG
jgi:hypothetical protein